MIGMVAVSAAACLMNLVDFGLSQISDWPALCLAAAGIMAAFLMPPVERLRELMRRRLVWALVAFLLWAMLAAFLSPRVFPAIFGDFGSGIGLLTIVAASLVALASMENAESVRRVIRIAAPWAILAEAVFVGYYAMIPQYTLNGGTFANSSYLAAFLVLALPAAYAQLETRSQWLAAGVVALALAMMHQGQARAGVIVVLVWTCVVAARKLRAPAEKAARRLAALGLGVVALAVLAAAIFWRSPVTQAVSGFADERLIMLRSAWFGALQRPVSGWGPDGYALASYAHIPFRGLWAGYPTAGAPADPHNLFAWVLVSTGFVGLALFVWMLVEIAIDWFAQPKEKAAAARPFVQGIFMYGVLCLTAPAALQTLPVAVLVLGCSLAGLAGAVEHTTSRARPANRETGRPLTVVLPAALLCGLLAAHTLSSILLTPSEKVRPAEAARTQAIADLWRFDARFFFQASLEWAVSGDVKGGGAEPRDLVAIRRAYDLAPTNPVFVLEYAKTLGFYGRPPDQAEPMYARASSLFPSLPDAPSAAAEYRLSRGDLEGARDALDRANSIGETTEYLRVESLYWQKVGDSARAALFEAKFEERRQGKAQYWTKPSTVEQ